MSCNHHHSFSGKLPKPKSKITPKEEEQVGITESAFRWKNMCGNQKVANAGTEMRPPLLYPSTFNTIFLFFC